MDAFSQLYPQLVADVVSNVSKAFQNEGVSESVLEKLRSQWIAKITAHHGQQTPQDQPHIPEPHGYIYPVGQLGPVIHPAIPTFHHFPPTQQTYPTTPAGPVDVLSMFTQSEPTLPNNTIESKEPPIKKEKIDSDSTKTSAADAAASRILADEVASVPLPAGVGEEDIAAMSEISDVDEIEEEQIQDTDNVLLCLWESVDQKSKKVGHKFTMSLFNGIGTINQKDVFFSKAQCEGTKRSKM
ncbi:hypothetical protein P9112_008957 [Eukaryota sp. TZLM1-RC]